MNGFSAFVTLQKVDVAKREVWGVAAVEQPDRAGEIMDYAMSKGNFVRWSQDMKKASGGKSQGNVRAMHADIAAGKVIHFEPNDEKKLFYIGTKIVDDNEWRKVLEGVYTGFSVGGSYGKKWADPSQFGLTRYEAKPVEISLVDVPCIPGAQFEVIKADGIKEMRKFVTVAGPGDLAKGDKDGHPFRGNQWTTGQSVSHKGRRAHILSTDDESKDAWINYEDNPDEDAIVSHSELSTINAEDDFDPKMKHALEFADPETKDSAAEVLEDAGISVYSHGNKLRFETPEEQNDAADILRANGMHGLESQRAPLTPKSNHKGDVESNQYDWGRLTTVRYKNDYGVVLHPEHQAGIAQLGEGESYDFTDETRSKWRATLSGDEVVFQGAGDGNENYHVSAKVSDLKLPYDQPKSKSSPFLPSGKVNPSYKGNLTAQERATGMTEAEFNAMSEAGHVKDWGLTSEGKKALRQYRTLKAAGSGDLIKLLAEANMNADELIKKLKGSSDPAMMILAGQLRKAFPPPKKKAPGEGKDEPAPEGDGGDKPAAKGKGNPFAKEKDGAEEEAVPGEENAPGEEDDSEMESGDMPEDEIDPKTGEPVEQAGQMSPEQAEAVKMVVISLLEELGLVQRQESAPGTGGMQLSVSVTGLAKAMGVQGLSKRFETVLGDVGKLAAAVDDLEKRLGVMPVLREIGGSANPLIEQQAELLKGMLAGSHDPNIRQAIQNELATLEIKKIQSSKKDV